MKAATGLLLLLAAAGFLPIAGQNLAPRIWTGVYSTEQAERGKANFATSCVRCHGQDLAGVTAPSLRGSRFMTAWENESIYRLFIKVRDTMPPNFGTALTEEAKLDVVAYLLQANNFPPGGRDLKIDGSDLEGIQIVQKDAAPADIPNFSLVQIVGCLSRAADNSWVLSDTSEPAPARDQPSTPEELSAAAGRPPGLQKFRLVSVSAFAPESHAGQRMEAKGLLYKDGTDARLNLTSLQPVGSRCPQN